MAGKNRAWRPLSYIFVTWLLVGLVFSAAAGVPVSELPPRPHPARFVNDLAGVLRPEQARALEQKLHAYQDSTSTQLVVVLLHSTGAYEVADYAQQLGVAWGVGQKGQNNGLVILAAIDQHRMAIETGYGMEATITDALTNDIMREQFQPNFRRGDYYAGLDAGVDVLMQHARGEFEAAPDVARSVHIPWWFRLLAGVFGLVVLAAVFYGVRRAWGALTGSGSQGKKGSPALAKSSRRGAARRKPARSTAAESSFFGFSASDSDSSSSSDSSSDSSDFGGGDFGGGGSSSDW
ncbi:TPM domain-containing protein [Hymenobacter terricola]|uniref:TPM domain-containing protein n=1 Tax=Hymenobacter terricola TaxID=2819236 RepID=UPI001B3067A7|nr:TPM domain-containing protein [Hymenobacter terricola]